VNQTICRAIRERKVISFFYGGGNRLVEPHYYSESRDRNELLRAYQIGGHSESGQPQGWKLFRINELSSLSITEKTFPGPRPQYNPNDKAMATVYCCL